MLNDINIRNFRGVDTLKLGPFGGVNLLVGRNNSGKTTVLEALFLACGPTNPQLALQINTQRTWRVTTQLSLDDYYWRLFFRDMDIGQPIEIAVHFSDGEERKLAIEAVKSTSGFMMHVSGSMDPDTGSMLDDVSAVPEDRVEGLRINSSISGGAIRERLNIVSEVVAKDDKFKTGSTVKDYQEGRKAVYVSQRRPKADVGVRFSELQRNKQEQPFIDVLKRLDEKVRSVALGADGGLYLDVGLSRLLPLSVLGQGTQSILDIVLSILVHRSGLAFVDEIENGLHVTSQKVLWDALFSMAKSYGIQLFITTHSYETVELAVAASKHSDAEALLNLIRVERTDEGFHAIQLGSDEIQTAIEEKWEFR